MNFVAFFTRVCVCVYVLQYIYIYMRVLYMRSCVCGVGCTRTSPYRTRLVDHARAHRRSSDPSIYSSQRNHAWATISSPLRQVFRGTSRLLRANKLYHYWDHRHLLATTLNPLSSLSLSGLKNALRRCLVAKVNQPLTEFFVPKRRVYRMRTCCWEAC